MSFIDRLDSLLKKHQINKNQLSARTGIPVSTIYGWYKKGYDNMTLPTLKKLSDYFGVSMEYLASGRDYQAEGPSDRALEIAARFDSLDEQGKHLIETILEVECKRCTADPLADLNARLDAARDEYFASQAEVLKSKAE